MSQPRAFQTSMTVALLPFPMEQRDMCARTGYTGETGYEIIIPQGDTNDYGKILEEGEHNLRLIGLGARDTLRTEMGFCLYGQDIDENKSPKEAGLMWAGSRSGRLSWKSSTRPAHCRKKAAWICLGKQPNSPSRTSDLKPRNARNPW